MIPLTRLVHTLRWLPPAQIAALVGQRVRGVLERPEAFARRTAPDDPGTRWEPAAAFEAPAPLQDAEALRQGRFRFLQREEALGWPPRWSDPGPSRLWLYNLHYFEWLWALDFEEARAAVLDWIAQHPLGAGQAGWEPYPVSLRLQNWCAFLHGRHASRTRDDAPLREALWRSVWLQAEWLAAHLEHHLRGNHLLENAAALALCGACFDGPDAAAWLRRGCALLARELPEQVLADGGHFERAPMYHARVTTVLGLLAASGCPELLALVEAPLARSRAALARLTHPDGDVALLNDSAIGIVRPARDLVTGPLPSGSFHLDATGYFGARSDDHYVVCDAAPIGPDYIPGHAHADLLSFELSLAGQRVVVDAGVHGYDGDPHRSWCRSTRAHNTVEIDGVDQCELWGTFRVARRGRPRDVRFDAHTGGFALDAAHDGYERLPGRPRHRRVFRWHERGVLLVHDRIDAGRGVVTRSRLHLHPECEVEILAPIEARVRHPRGTARIVFAGAGRLALEPSLYCPEFGVAHETQALVFLSDGAHIETGFCIAHAAHGDCDVRYDLASGAVVDGIRYAW